MKKVIFILLILPAIGYGQSFSFITAKDSIFAEMQAISQKAFLTSKGYIYISEVSKAYQHGEITDYYKDKFRSLNIPLLSTDMSEEVPTILEVNNEITPQQINEKLLKFSKARSAGYTMEILGIAATALGLAIDQPNVAAGGAGLSLLGLLVNSGAGSHLK